MLQLLQCVPVYPSRQPLRHTPLILSHGLLFKHCPLQRSLQFIPKYPAKQPRLNKSCFTKKKSYIFEY